MLNTCVAFLQEASSENPDAVRLRLTRAGASRHGPAETAYHPSRAYKAPASLQPRPGKGTTHSPLCKRGGWGGFHQRQPTHPSSGNRPSPLPGTRSAVVPPGIRPAGRLEGLAKPWSVPYYVSPITDASNNAVRAGTGFLAALAGFVPGMQLVTGAVLFGTDVGTGGVECNGWSYKDLIKDAKEHSQTAGIGVQSSNSM